VGKHLAVLKDEAVESLAIKPGGIYIDATFGRGGHSKSILTKLNSSGKLLVFDRDQEAIIAAQQLCNTDVRVTAVKAVFSSLYDYCVEHGLVGKIDGILFDLGVSSLQIDTAERGFSFMRDGPLDMRMDSEQKISAAIWINTSKEEEIVRVLKEYGEERFARRIASSIVEQRKIAPITGTKKLVEIIQKSIPRYDLHKHPATRTFQAIRIVVNAELEQIKKCLEKVIDILSIGGRLVVISFHSLEDRIVKQFINKEVKGDDYLPDLPIPASLLNPRLKKIGKAVKATEAEIVLNKRARSAIMRVAEKV
jgi:16S rRNA (cytosine1402-N4)-methyltransferase